MSIWLPPFSLCKSEPSWREKRHKTSAQCLGIDLHRVSAAASSRDRLEL